MMTMTKAPKTVTNAQMCWMLKKGFAWVEGSLDDHEWHHPIYTREGEYRWDATAQVYEMVG